MSAQNILTSDDLLEGLSKLELSTKSGVPLDTIRKMRGEILTDELSNVRALEIQNFVNNQLSTLLSV